MESLLIQTARWLYPFVHGFGLGVIAMLLHEAGHWITAFALGVRIKNVGMKWNKGMYTVREQGTIYQNLLIALAGPLVNVLLIPVAGWSSPFALANFCYALANLLPIEGSDGYRINMCWRQIRSGRTVT